jgi:hypothetical protein
MCPNIGCLVPDVIGVGDHDEGEKPNGTAINDGFGVVDV